MPTDIKLKNSVTATNAPTSLQQGEVAINITDKKMWVGNAATTPVQIVGTGSGGGGAAGSNTQVQFNSSGALAGSANLTFSGTILTATGFAGPINGTVGATTAAAGNFTTLGATGVATFSAGTVSAPAITTTGDTNTGIYFPAADTIAFTEGGVESMRLDSSGNLGVGTNSPSTYGKFVTYSSGGYGAIDTSGQFISYQLLDVTTAGGRLTGGSNQGLLGSIGIEQAATGAKGGYINFLTCPSGSNTPSERMRITSAGLVGIGTGSPTALLTVQKSQNADTQLQVVNADGGTAAAARMDIVDNASSFLTMQALSQGYSGSFWGVTAAKLKVIFDNSAPTFSNGLMLGTSGSTPLYFATAGTQRMIITSAGRLGVGTTSPAELLDSRGAAVFSGDNATATNNFGTASGILLSTASDNSVARITAVSNGNNSVGLSLRSLSSGNAVEGIRIAADGTITFTQTTLASYLWTSWSPTNLTGTVTNAPSTGTGNDSNYVTMANSSGTLTVTFDIAGKYQICINSATLHANVYSFDRLQTNLGGTATRQYTPTQPSNSGDPSNDTNFSITTSFYVVATAAQTLTILPSYELTGGGTTANHVAYCNVTIQYCGG